MEDNRLYTIISVLVVVLIFVVIIFSSSETKEAVVSDEVLDEGWYEDGEERFFDSRFFGLEKHISFTYRQDNYSFPSFLTVNTYKTVFMMNENDLFETTIDAIESSMQEKNVILDNQSVLEGDRVLENKHKTLYIVYNGTKISKNSEEKIKVIGETWNCGDSGTSIIVIGYAQVTNNSVKNLSNWAKIVRDQSNTFGFYGGNDEYIFLGKDGLIFNIECH